MKRWHQYVTAAAGIGVFTVVLSMTVARPVSAQSGQPTLGTILAAITSLGASVPSALSNIQSSLDALTAQDQANVRVTPPLPFNIPTVVHCPVVNVADSPRTVRMQILNSSGAEVQGATIVLPAGGAHFLSFGLSGVTVYCKFTVGDGSRTDIRGAIELSDGRTLPAE